MSPEQARGGKADFRSDQFALGVMLYEMATATHPFQRETSVQTLSAIIADDPPDPAQATPPVPFALRLLLRRLLAKNPRERFQHTADLAAELRTTRELLTEGTSAVSTPVVIRRAIWPRRVAVMALIAAAGLVAGRALAPAESRPSFDRFVPFATDAGYQGVPAWSPDGKTIAYEAEIDGVVQIFTRIAGLADADAGHALGLRLLQPVLVARRPRTSTITRWRATPTRCGRSVPPAGRPTSSSKARRARTSRPMAAPPCSCGRSRMADEHDAVDRLAAGRHARTVRPGAARR